MIPYRQCKPVEGAIRLLGGQQTLQKQVRGLAGRYCRKNGNCR